MNGLNSEHSTRIMSAESVSSLAVPPLLRLEQRAVLEYGTTLDAVRKLNLTQSHFWKQSIQRMADLFATNRVLTMDHSMTSFLGSESNAAAREHFLSNGSEARLAAELVIALLVSSGVIRKDQWMRLPDMLMARILEFASRLNFDKQALKQGRIKCKEPRFLFEMAEVMLTAEFLRPFVQQRIETAISDGKLTNIPKGTSRELAYSLMYDVPEIHQPKYEPNTNIAQTERPAFAAILDELGWKRDDFDGLSQSARLYDYFQDRDTTGGALSARLAALRILRTYGFPERGVLTKAEKSKELLTIRIPDVAPRLTVQSIQQCRQILGERQWREYQRFAAEFISQIYLEYPDDGRSINNTGTDSSIAAILTAKFLALLFSQGILTADAPISPRLIGELVAHAHCSLVRFNAIPFDQNDQIRQSEWEFFKRAVSAELNARVLMPKLVEIAADEVRMSPDTSVNSVSPRELVRRISSLLFVRRLPALETSFIAKDVNFVNKIGWPSEFLLGKNAHELSLRQVHDRILLEMDGRHQQIGALVDTIFPSVPTLNHESTQLSNYGEWTGSQNKMESSAQFVLHGDEQLEAIETGLSVIEWSTELQQAMQNLSYNELQQLQRLLSVLSLQYPIWTKQSGDPKFQLYKKAHIVSAAEQMLEVLDGGSGKLLQNIAAHASELLLHPRDAMYSNYPPEGLLLLELIFLVNDRYIATQNQNVVTKRVFSNLEENGRESWRFAVYALESKQMSEAIWDRLREMGKLIRPGSVSSVRRAFDSTLIYPAELKEILVGIPAQTILSTKSRKWLQQFLRPHWSGLPNQGEVQSILNSLPSQETFEQTDTVFLAKLSAGELSQHYTYPRWVLLKALYWSVMQFQQ